MKHTTYTARTLELLSEMVNEEIGRLTGIEALMIERGAPALMVEETRMLGKIRDARESLIAVTDRVRSEIDAEFEWIEQSKAGVVFTKQA